MCRVGFCYFKKSAESALRSGNGRGNKRKFTKTDSSSSLSRRRRNFTAVFSFRSGKWKHLAFHRLIEVASLFPRSCRKMSFFPRKKFCLFNINISVTYFTIHLSCSLLPQSQILRAFFNNTQRPDLLPTFCWIQSVFGELRASKIYAFIIRTRVCHLGIAARKDDFMPQKACLYICGATPYNTHKQLRREKRKQINSRVIFPFNYISTPDPWTLLPSILCLSPLLTRALRLKRNKAPFQMQKYKSFNFHPSFPGDDDDGCVL